MLGQLSQFIKACNPMPIGHMDYYPGAGIAIG
jgi:hypothetical protein